MDVYELIHDYVILKAALTTISQELDCEGPNCMYCETDEHPFSNVAKIAQKALSEVKI